MKVETIDLEEFFDDKYRYLRGLGIGATGIITTSQMVTRVNSDDSHGEEFKGVGSHEEAEIAIIRDIFGFDDVLDNGMGFFDKKTVIANMGSEYKKMLKEVIKVIYFNNDNGNRIIIYLPEKTKHLTTSQLEAIKHLGTKVEEVSSRLSKEIAIDAVIEKNNINKNNYVEEINGVSEVIIPFLSQYIDDTIVQSIEDKNIIAAEDVITTQKVM